ncbi:hypothetical protein Q9Q94_12125 [Uliginosibacterium sp. 31-16]|uniref:hypothetical protein n=1 Tax=Uliginosibacterium sp. 31-16 TaxID=3068315 RepID=UPI0027401884|nr:hypothetical protein [Uliginosibacterium sp. 31-16]MDP5240280.1 hypothetical protein [Uliginosibacterium sp. 31-16]
MSRPWAPWQRVLLAGVAASVLLHGVAMDLWRGSAGLKAASGGASGLAPLQGRLHKGSADTLPAEQAPTRLVEESDMVRAAAGHESPTLAQSPRENSAAGVMKQTATPDAPLPVMPGVRPLSVTEGLVAYRLDLLEVLAPSTELPAPLRVGLSVPAGPGVAQLTLRQSSGDTRVDQLWQDDIMKALPEVEVPAVLAGRAFELELVFEP